MVVFAKTHSLRHRSNIHQPAWALVLMISFRDGVRGIHRFEPCSMGFHSHFLNRGRKPGYDIQISRLQLQKCLSSLGICIGIA